MYRRLPDAGDLGNLGDAADRVGDALTAAGYAARATGGTDLTIEVDRVSEADSDAVIAATGLDPSRVLLRPVEACPATGGPSSVPATAAIAQVEVVPMFGGGECTVGPAAADGGVFAPGAEAEILGPNGWGVTVELRAGTLGVGRFNALAADCYAGNATCPSHQIAIQVDGEIVSAPTVQVPSFAGAVQIVGSFGEADARRLADVLVAGSLASGLTLWDTSFAPG